jgi:hypothetical protein
MNPSDLGERAGLELRLLVGEPGVCRKPGLGRADAYDHVLRIPVRCTPALEDERSLETRVRLTAENGEHAAYGTIRKGRKSREP